MVDSRVGQLAGLWGTLRDMVEAPHELPDSETDRLFRLLYDRLRAMAGAIRATDPSPTIQPTELVHEAFLRLDRAAETAFVDERHFKAVAAKVMRQILLDRARKRRAARRGGGWARVTLTNLAVGTDAVDVIALDDILTELETLDERRATVVQMRVFGGLNHREVGEVLGLAERTVRKEWRLARAWVVSRLKNYEESPPDRTGAE